ncbi:Uncharacterized membrane protein [Clostridium cavendishii DSM 21758]|uniref:Uncharacterized membrane protein n=1 Tax=Clostridium cavendishii DSM 21758 TaxID=1121302 RepID=A0A1M6CHX3_9CLOT|nr:ECF transporter S component [Clostridium cavendishii]SHI60620.1 Uncharacterized membrane protein [Clostridium cavendishii DSM 21758]
MEKNLVTSSSLNTRKLVVAGMLSAISIFLGLTGLGFIAIPPVKATIMHIPVIIGAIIEGPIVGAIIGLCFGLFSIYQAFTTPTPTSFIFWNPIIAILPRVLIGVVSYYIYAGMSKAVKKHINLAGIFATATVSFMLFIALKVFLPIQVDGILTAIVFILLSVVVIKFKHTNKEKVLSIGTASILGTLTNTALVLGLVYLIYADRFAKAINVSPEIAGKFIAGIGITNGIPEALISALVTIPVVIAILKIKKK